MALDNNRYLEYEKIYDYYGKFIETIKSYDDSIYFWIQGGSLRRAIDDSLEFGWTDDWYWDIDVDIHVLDSDSYFKFVDILTNKMGFTKSKDYHWNTFFSLFGVVRVDVAKPAMGNIAYENNRWPRPLLHMGPTEWPYWADFTITSPCLDSNFMFSCHKDFFEDVQNKKLFFVQQDWQYIYKQIEKYDDKIFKEKLKLLFGFLFIQRRYVYKMKNLDPRYIKYSEEGFQISKLHYEESKIELDNLKKDLSKYLDSFEKGGWSQDSQYYGIINEHLNEKNYPITDEYESENLLKAMLEIMYSVQKKDLKKMILTRNIKEELKINDNI